MRNLTRVGRGLGMVGAATLALGLAAPAAYADYGPTKSDVVGVGSDTVQYAADFIADGDHLGDAGYNAAGNVNRLVNMDATPDSNARLAYGSSGLGPNCGPGTGSTSGTGTQTTTHSDTPCTLNPSLVLRAGRNPVQRPNGSGAGVKLLWQRDTAAPHLVDYARASDSAGNILGSTVSLTGLDSIQIGTDPLAILKASTSNAPVLSTAQLNAIYTCSSTAATWNQVGGTATTTIIPVLPQVGSGTRSSFLKALGNGTAITPGACVKTAEENDPTAIYAFGSSADTIEPMSGGRLNLFQGKLGNGTGNNGTGTPITYFNDPSCGALVTTAPCPQAINPAVTLTTTGTASDGAAAFSINRPLYIYFRDSDVSSSTPYQPGSSLNFVRTLFYNPCSTGLTGCVTVSGTTYGPGGPPYYAQAAGQALISAAGINPTYVFNANGP